MQALASRPREMGRRPWACPLDPVDAETMARPRPAAAPEVTSRARKVFAVVDEGSAPRRTEIKPEYLVSPSRAPRA